MKNVKITLNFFVQKRFQSFDVVQLRLRKVKKHILFMRGRPGRRGRQCPILERLADESSDESIDSTPPGARKGVSPGSLDTHPNHGCLKIQPNHARLTSMNIEESVHFDPGSCPEWVKESEIANKLPFYYSSLGGERP